MTRLLLMSVVLAACRAPADAVDTAEVPARVCDPVVSGRWSATGPGFGMPMEVTLTFDPARCEIVATDWSMSHSSQMWGAIVDHHDEVTLFGSDDYWASCAGTVESDGAAIVGLCADHAVSGDFELNLLGG